MAQGHPVSSEGFEQSIAEDSRGDQISNRLTESAKLEALRAAIDEGFASGIAEDGVFERVRKSIGLPTRT